MSRPSLFRLVLAWGFFGVLFGVFHFVSGLSSGLTSISIGDAAINFVNGLLSFTAAWLISQRKQAAIAVVFLSILASIIYGFVVGRGVNYVVIIIGAYFLWQLYGLKMQGELI